MHQTDRLGAVGVLISHHAFVFLLLTHYYGGHSQVLGQSQPITAAIGDDITLPCHVTPAQDASAEMMEWSKQQTDPRFVHVRRSGEDRLGDQNQLFRGRTLVSTSGLARGDVSLTLSRVTLSDEGTYRCFVPGLRTETTVQLVVKAVINITKVSSGVLECKSSGWYPEPEVSWLDAEGNLLSAGRPETVRGPDGLYTVSSRVTVEKRHDNTFTCRVHQQGTQLSRETQIQVPEESGSSLHVVIGVTFGLMCVLIVILVVLWKLRQKKRKSKNLPEDSQRQSSSRTKSNSVRDTSEKKKLIEPKEDDGETMKNMDNKEEESIQVLDETRGLNNPSEVETNKTKLRAETVPEQRRETKERSLNTETQPQFQMDGKRQQEELQTGGQKEEDVLKREEADNKLLNEKTPGPTGGEKQETDERSIVKTGRDANDENNQTPTVNKTADQVSPQEIKNKETSDQGVNDGDEQRLDNSNNEGEDEQETQTSDDKTSLNHAPNEEETRSKESENGEENIPENADADNQSVTGGQGQTDGKETQPEKKLKNEDRNNVEKDANCEEAGNNDQRPKGGERQTHNENTQTTTNETTNRVSSGERTQLKEAKETEDSQDGEKKRSSEYTGADDESVNESQPKTEEEEGNYPNKKETSDQGVNDGDEQRLEAKDGGAKDNSSNEEEDEQEAQTSDDKTINHAPNEEETDSKEAEENEDSKDGAKERSLLSSFIICSENTGADDESQPKTEEEEGNHPNKREENRTKPTDAETTDHAVHGQKV